MSLAPGTRLGAYEVLAPLGAGGMRDEPMMKRQVLTPVRGMAQSLTAQTPGEPAEARVTEMSDADLEAYDRLLTELQELLPKDEPRRIGSGSRS